MPTKFNQAVLPSKTPEILPFSGEANIMVMETPVFKQDTEARNNFSKMIGLTSKVPGTEMRSKFANKTLLPKVINIKQNTREINSRLSQNSESSIISR